MLFLGQILGLSFLSGFGDTMAEPHTGYFFHGFAASQIVGDPKFFDRSGNLADGTPGADLSNANLWTNAGYASTVDPAGGATDSVIRLPNLNFDYIGGEKLIVWWLAKLTAEGAAASMMGDGIGTGGLAGVSWRLNTNGTHQLVMSDGVAANTFSGSSTTAITNGALMAIAFAIDGQARKYCLWTEESDGQIHGFSNASAYSTLGTGQDVDTRNPNTWNIGCANPKSSASTAGIATQTRALVMIRLSPTATMPSVGLLNQLFNALRRSPDRLIRSGAF